MQFAHARCLVDEREAIGEPLSSGARRAWPEGFGDVYEAACPRAGNPQEFDAIARLGGDTPHRNYPLRSVGESNYDIKFNDDSDRLGDVTQSQALRECYPGAAYYHMMKSYEVIAWRTSSYQPYIQVKGARPGYATRPRITTWVNTGIRSGDLVEGHLLRSNKGFLAECQMHITEMVNGYVDLRTGAYRSYKELQKKNFNMKSRRRSLRTTGVLLCINEDWFREDSFKRIAAWTGLVSYLLTSTAFCHKTWVPSRPTSLSMTAMAVCGGAVASPYLTKRKGVCVLRRNCLTSSVICWSACL